MTTTFLRGAWSGALMLLFAAGAWAHPHQDAKQPERLAERDVEFVREATRVNLAEIALGELARDKALHAEVRQFASRMIDDHRRANRELERIAERHGLTLPAVFSEDTRERIVELNERKGPEFDKAYMEFMLDKQREEIEFYRERFEDDEIAPTLRTYANRMKRTLQAHENAALATRDVVLRGERYGDRKLGSRR